MFNIVVGIVFMISSQVLNWLFITEENGYYLLAMIASGSICAGITIGEGIGQLMKIVD